MGDGSDVTLSTKQLVEFMNIFVHFFAGLIVKLGKRYFLTPSEVKFSATADSLTFSLALGRQYVGCVN